MRENQCRVRGGAERSPGSPLVAEVVGVDQAPLPPAVMVAPVVALSREVEPLGVAKLVALRRQGGRQ